jgi:hypothetical protein
MKTTANLTRAPTLRGGQLPECVSSITEATYGLQLAVEQSESIML